MTTKAWAAALLILTCPAVHAQVPAGQWAEFEVASIKPNRSNERLYYGIRNSSMTIRNMPVKGMIQIAYGRKDFQVAGGPAWIATECFDVEAKAERPLKATPDMLKALLASRFQLKVHRETKETLAWSLTVARGGLKMKPSADQSEPEKGGPREMGAGRLAGSGIPLYIVVNLLGNMLGRPVIDNTGLTGKFDVDLRVLPDTAPAPSDNADPLAAADAANFALVQAIEKQLGLRMEPIKAPQEVVVIDSIEHPTAN